MGLEKREGFDPTRDSIFEAAGYSLEITRSELEPRAALLANQIVAGAGMCPTMAIEILMDSPILRDTALDNRDRAMIILLAGPVIASVMLEQAVKDPEGLRTRTCSSNYGFEHNSGKEEHVVLKLSKAEWDQLTDYAERKIFKHEKTLELVENVERMLDDNNLGSLQKAVVGAFVVKNSALETARNIVPTAEVLGALGSVHRS
jgi:hypothetical protein